MGYGERILPEQAENQGDLGILEIRHLKKGAGFIKHEKQVLAQVKDPG